MMMMMITREGVTSFYRNEKRFFFALFHFFCRFERNKSKVREMTNERFLRFLLTLMINVNTKRKVISGEIKMTKMRILQTNRKNIFNLW